MTLIPPGARASHIDLDGARVRVLRAGPGQPTDRLPLLLVHGGGTDHAAVSWYTVYEPLSRHREMYGPDLPGFGQPDGLAPVGGPAELADYIARAAESVGVHRAIVFGVSMGGDVAINLALRHPDLVAGLVLVGATGLAPRRGRLLQFGAWLFGKLPDRVLMPVVEVATRFVRPAVAFMVTDYAGLPERARAEYIREGRRRRASIGYVRYHQAVFGPTAMTNCVLPDVHRIDVPTLVIHGADDPLVNPRGSEVAARLMPDARLVLVPDCGHLVQLEEPEAFLAAVRPFLAELP